MIRVSAKTKSSSTVAGVDVVFGTHSRQQGTRSRWRGLARRAAAAALAVAFVACAAAPPAAAQQRWRFSDVPRVVVVGDVHGAYSALVGLLQATGLVDSSLDWTGGTTHLVSLGDLIDRGPDSRKVLDLLMKLQSAAEARGGQVHVVLGNHELMNLIGDWRYVTPADFAAFAAEETPAMRAEAFAAFQAEHQENAGNDAAARARFDAAYPPGYFARAAAFAPTGRYGAWLLERPALIVIDGTAYVHGGLPPMVAATTLDALNTRTQHDIAHYLQLRADLANAGVLPVETMAHDYSAAATALKTATDHEPAIKEFLELADAPELGVDGPLWYRGSVYCRPIVEQPKLTAALTALGADRVVVGHTPTENRRVDSLYDGKLVMLDTGMLADYYNGHPAALVIDPDTTYVQYLGAKQPAGIEADGRVEAYGLTRAALLDALEHGDATIDARKGSVWQLTVATGAGKIQAVFYPSRRDGAANRELAASALDTTLATELVPPTVARIVDGTPGAVQLRYADGLTESERLKRNLGFPETCPIQPQIDLMHFFDVLTFNRGRTADNVLYHHELARLSVVDFADAFGTERRLPTGFDPATLKLPQALRKNLASLDSATLDGLLGQWLSKSQILALLARRDGLLEGAGR